MMVFQVPLDLVWYWRISASFAENHTVLWQMAKQTFDVSHGEGMREWAILERTGVYSSLCPFRL